MISNFLLFLTLFSVLASNVSAVLTDAKAYYSFDDDYIDTARGYNLTAGGSGNAFVTGVLGNAINFTGSGNAETTSTTDFMPNGDVDICVSF